MRKEIVHEVCRLMGTQLNGQQGQYLERILEQVLQRFGIGEEEDAQQSKMAADNAGAVSRFIAAKKIEGCSDSTLKYYANTLNTLLSSVQKNVCQITTDDLRLYLSHYQNTRKASKVTIDNIRRIMSSFFAWLEDEDYIVKSPVRRIHKVKTTLLVKEPLSDESLEHLRDECSHKRDRAMVDLLVSTGIRVGELVKLNREDINFTERECVVLGKGDKERRVYFDAKTKVHLEQYLESRADGNPALFVSYHAPWNRLTIAGVEYMLRQLGTKSSVSHVHPHKFRRTMATMAIERGMPIEQVQKLLGHAKIDTTLRYAVINQTNVKNAHRHYLC